jgi:predicted dehydrogenase
VTETSVLVIGCGSIGRRHIANLRTLGVETVFAYDPDVTVCKASIDLGALPVASLEEGLSKSPSAVAVCSPPDSHLDLATQALESGAHLFIEKPIAPSSTRVGEVTKLAESRNRVLMVGYNLRFQAGLQKVKQLIDANAIGEIISIRAEFGYSLPLWRPGTDYRDGYFARESSGGGILLDASHELDYLIWLGGDPASVYALVDHKSALEIETEDVALLLMRLKSGALAEVHLDVIDSQYTRRCKIIGGGGTIEWDFNGGVTINRIGESYSEIFPIDVDLNQMYLDEMNHFIGCIDGTEIPPVGGAHAQRLMELVESAKLSSKERREIKFPE